MYVNLRKEQQVIVTKYLKCCSEFQLKNRTCMYVNFRKEKQDIV